MRRGVLDRLHPRWTKKSGELKSPHALSFVNSESASRESRTAEIRNSKTQENPAGGAKW